MFDFNFKRWRGTSFETVKIGKPSVPYERPPERPLFVSPDPAPPRATSLCPTGVRHGVATQDIKKGQMVKLNLNGHGFFNVTPWTINITAEDAE